MVNPDITYRHNPDKRWLLLPSMYNVPGKPDFDHVGDQTRAMFGGRSKILIVTNAKTPAEGQDQIMGRIEANLARFGAKDFLHAHQMSPEDLSKAAENDIQGVLGWGGNTFRLLKALHEPNTSLARWISWMVADGRPYHGTSASQMALAEDVRTCTDPRNIVSKINGISAIDIQGLNIIRGGVNIHPHYQESVVDSEAELQSYATEDPTRKILAVRNGAALYVQGRALSVVGEGDGVDLITATRTSTFAPGQRLPIPA